MIALLSAVPFEQAVIKKAMKGKKNSGGFTLGSFRDREVILAASGIGAANAARAVAAVAERHRPRAVVYFGIGGAYPNAGLSHGDIAAATEEVYGDSGVIGPEGFSGMQTIGFPLLQKGSKKYFNAFPCDKKLLKKACRVLPGLKAGRFVTVCAATRTPGRAVIQENRWGGLVENMEGAAAAQTALFYGIPFLEIRGISNMAGDPPEKWQKELAAEECQSAVVRLLEVTARRSPFDIPGLRKKITREQILEAIRESRERG